jgi:hypothetical protein
MCSAVTAGCFDREMYSIKVNAQPGEYDVKNALAKTIKKLLVSLGYSSKAIVSLFDYLAETARGVTSLLILSTT